MRTLAWCACLLWILSGCAERPASTLIEGGEVVVLQFDAGFDAGAREADAGSSCDLTAVARFCPASCDDEDPCTNESCSAETGFSCLSTPRCPGGLCVAGECVSEICTSRLELFGDCALDDGVQCLRLQPDGGTANTAGPQGTPRAECTPDQECTREGTCLPAPDRTLIVWPLDAGALLPDGGLPVDVAVRGVRNQDDTAFQLRTSASLQYFGLRSATRLIFPATFRWEPDKAYVVTRSGDVVQNVEPLGTPGWLCELFDCYSTPPWPQRTSPNGTWVRQLSAGEARFGRVTPRFEASGEYVVHVFTFYDGPHPEWSLGQTLESLPPQCDPAIDALRDSWNAAAQAWTNGAISLRFTFVDHGVLALPDDETLGRLGRPFESDPLRNSTGMAKLAALQVPHRGPRDLFLVAYVGVHGMAGGGMALPDDGIAVVGVGRQRAGFNSTVALHELGHLFGAVDLYDTNSPTGCTPEQNDEFSHDLYCRGAGVSRVNARELGWVLPDGGAASAVTHVCQSPASSFGCDPD
jgi:hypothetical protein